MLDPLFQVIFDNFKNIGVLLWGLDWVLLRTGYMILKFNDLLVVHVFTPGLTALGHQIYVGILPSIFTIAIIVLGITYVMAAFWVKDLNLVDWKKALAWLLGAILFYQMGPALYRDGEIFRRQLSSVMYNIVLGIQSDTQTSAYLDPDPNNPDSLVNVLRANMSLGDPYPMGTLVNQFGPPYSDLDTSIDGLDVSMAYLLTNRTEVLDGQSNDLPDQIEGNFFTLKRICRPVWWGEQCDPVDWSSYIGREILGISRLFMGIFIIIFGIAEQSIYLLLSLAAAIVMFTLALTLPLAFFTRTEGIARALIKAYFQLFLTALFTSIIQAAAVFVVVFGAMTGNPGIALGMTLLGLVLISIALRFAVKAILDLLSSLPVVGGVVGAAREYGESVSQRVQQAAMMATMMASGGFRAGMGAATGASPWAGSGRFASSPTMGITSLFSPGSSTGRMGAGGGLAGFGGAASAAPMSSGGTRITAQEGIHTSPGNTGGTVSGAASPKLPNLSSKASVRGPLPQQSSPLPALPTDQGATAPQPGGSLLGAANAPAHSPTVGGVAGVHPGPLNDAQEAQTGTAPTAKRVVGIDPERFAKLPPQKQDEVRKKMGAK